jgi:hypothetical protein
MLPMLDPTKDEIISARFLGERFGDRKRSEISALFNLVADKAHWKNPIDARVELTFDEADLLREVVIFYTGSVPTLEVLEPTANRTDGKSLYRVTADGYYVAIGA